MAIDSFRGARGDRVIGIATESRPLALLAVGRQFIVVATGTSSENALVAFALADLIRQ